MTYTPLRSSPPDILWPLLASTKFRYRGETQQLLGGRDMGFFRRPHAILEKVLHSHTFEEEVERKLWRLNPKPLYSLSKIQFRLPHLPPLPLTQVI